MANKINFKKIDLAFVEQNYPLLKESIDSITGLTIPQKELIAGLSIEIWMNSDGDPDMFADDLDLDFYVKHEII